MGNDRDYSQLPESDVLVKYVKERHNNGLYTFALVTGLPGTGKSSVCQRKAELVSKEIHGENRITPSDVVDDLRSFISVVRNAKQPGKIIIIEEVSVLFPSRRAMAQENLAVGRLLDTCRKKQIILLANAPIFGSIDSHMRAMAHILLETLHINKSQEVVVFKAWKLQTNPHSGKTYRHRFTRNGRDVSLFFTRKPSADLWEEYELKKDKFINDLYERLEKQAEKKEAKINKELGIKEKKKVVKKLTERELRRWTMRQQGMTYEQIAKKEGCSFQAVQNMIKNLENKTKLLGK